VSEIDIGEKMAKTLIKDAQKATPGGMIPRVRCRPAMFFIASLKLVVPLFILASSSFAIAALSVEEGRNPVCAQIAASISSSSDVYYPGIYISNPASSHID
jgi:hypothetical protein